MKKTFILVAILFAATFCQAQNTTTQTPPPQPITVTQEVLVKTLNEVYQKFGEETGKFLTKEHWDATMGVLSVYLKAALDSLSKKEPPVKNEPTKASKN